MIFRRLYQQQIEGRKLILAALDYILDLHVEHKKYLGRVVEVLCKLIRLATLVQRVAAVATALKLNVHR